MNKFSVEYWENLEGFNLLAMLYAKGGDEYRGALQMFLRLHGLDETFGLIPALEKTKQEVWEQMDW